MATNGSFTTTPRYASDSTNKKWYIFSWNLVSQNIENNTSTISYSVTGGGSKSSGYVMSYDRSVTIQGTQVYTSSADIQLRTGTEITSGTQVIQHDNNGNATLSASISSHIASTGSGGVSNGSGSWVLPQIPRYSTITTQTPTTMGTTQNVVVEQKSTTFSSIVSYKTSTGSYVELGRIPNGSSETFTWTLPDITATLLTSETDTYTIRCETYTSPNYTGTKLESLFDVVATVPETVVPQGTMQITDQESMPAGWGFVVNYSKLRATLTFDGTQDQNGYLASASAQFETYPVQTKTTTDTTTTQVTFDCPGTVVGQAPNVNATLTDSRGRQVNFNQTLSAIQYAKPQLYIELTRVDENGEASVVGTNCLARARWIIQSVMVGGAENNAGTIVVSGGNGQDISYQLPSITQTTLVTIGMLEGFPVEVDTSVIATISDKLDSTTLSTLKLPKATLAFSTWSDGTDNGVAFGKPALSKDFFNYMDTNLLTGKNINLINPDGSSAGKTITTDDLFETPIATNTEVGGVLSGGDITVDATGKMTVNTIQGYDAKPINLGAQLSRTSGGTLSTNVLYKWGPVYTLILNIKNSSSIASGSNAFQGTLAEAYRPPYTVSGASYYGNHSWGINITPSGTVSLRNASASAQAIPDGVEISVTWIKI